MTLPLLDIGIHMVLEALGGASMACALGLCKHRHHAWRALVWFPLALASSTLTVWLVG